MHYQFCCLLFCLMFTVAFYMHKKAATIFLTLAVNKYSMHIISKETDNLVIFIQEQTTETLLIMIFEFPTRYWYIAYTLSTNVICYKKTFRTVSSCAFH